MTRAPRLLLMLVMASSATAADAAIATYGFIGVVSGHAHVQRAAPEPSFEDSHTSLRYIDEPYHHEVLNLSANGPTSSPGAATFTLDSQASGSLGSALSLQLHDSLSASVKGCGPSTFCGADASQHGNNPAMEYVWAFTLTDTNYQLDISAITSALFTNSPNAEITSYFRFTGENGMSQPLFDYSITHHGDGTTSGSAAAPVSTLLTPGLYQLSARTTFFNFSTTASLPSTLDYSSTLNLSVVPVPLPAAAWLMLSGLGGLAALARRRRSSTTL